jgi:hypothetical protein
MTLVFNTIEHFIQMKIDRNNLLLKVIDIQNIILRKRILLQNSIIQSNKIKYNILQSINEIELKQLNEFDPELHNITSKMYDDYTLKLPDNYNEVKKEINLLEVECIELMNKINKYNNDLPNKVDWANIYYTRNLTPMIDNRFLEETEE